MKRRQGRWRDVEPGTYVKDKNGKSWYVLQWNHRKAVIRDRDGRTATVTPNPYDEVTMLVMTMEDAVKVVERKLGGVVITDERTDQ